MANRGKDLPPERIEEAKAQRARELQAIIDRLTGELEQLETKLAATTDQNERIMLKAEIVHFTLALKQIDGGAGQQRRKPPESGLAVPAVPPEGPQPRQGGAAAPLEFDT
ncbi:hypothetical protein [Erythrobacter colymbi]|uniref:hypothetical protein n=1 Tax=Erythrobacter colymbi TaxID=1161202 RepID=UPI000A3763BE|nr:hypothetical protein [Erythrobacter colymbi]